MDYKKLRLSEDHRIIGGVAGGLAEYFETDPVIVRMIFIFATFFGGAGFFVYLVLWIMLINREDIKAAEEEIKHIRHSQNNQALIGFFLIVIGALFLIDNLFPGFGLRTFWPIIIIFCGLAIMLRRHHR